MATDKKKETAKKQEEHKDWVKPYIAWPILAAELIIVIVIGLLVCRV